jgi:tetratricopeptide (TPR) repeat protein
MLIGPDAGGHTAPTELPPKEAAVACLAAAQELDKNGKVAEAVMLYEKARQQDPKVAAGVGRRLAVLHDLAGEFAKASAEYEPLLKATPRDPQLLNDVGYSYYCRGDFARAAEHLTQATSIDPSLKRAWLNLGLAVAAQGKLDEAFTAFQKAGSEAEARTNLAFALTAQGKTQEAVEQYNRALQLEPGLTQARAALDRLTNPKPKDGGTTDRNVIRADVRNRRGPARSEDVPNIYEIEERLKREDAEAEKAKE